jgi:potassium-transporting ATPase KdpC subunit
MERSVSMKNIKSAVLMFLVFTFLLGGVYPLVVTGFATFFFPGQAAGSFVFDKMGKAVGSSLIGQPFSAGNSFHSRPSATGDHAYNPLASGGSNLGPTNPNLLQQVAERVSGLHALGVGPPVPSDLVLASASGLDPHITPEAAFAQIPRVAQARGISEKDLESIVTAHIEDRQWGIFGQPRVNVLLLNLDLDGADR